MKKISAINVKINFDKKERKKTTTKNNTKCSTNHLITTHMPCFYPLHWSINDYDLRQIN